MHHRNELYDFHNRISSMGLWLGRVVGLCPIGHKGGVFEGVRNELPQTLTAKQFPVREFVSMIRFSVSTCPRFARGPSVDEAEACNPPIIGPTFLGSVVRSVARQYFVPSPTAWPLEVVFKETKRFLTIHRVGAVEEFDFSPASQPPLRLKKR
jgi:hypothetical protein